MTIAQKLNDWLDSIYDPTDPVYKSLIANPVGVPNVTIANPADINQGALTNLAEYFRLMSNNLVDQMDYNNASGIFLDLFNNKAFQVPGLSNETVQQHKDRVKLYVSGKKFSNAAIIVAMRPFSSVEPAIVNGDNSVAYADHSFASRYWSCILTSPGHKWDGYKINPAIARASDDAFFFTLILTGTSPSDMMRVFSILQVFIVGGIDYQLVIN